MGLAVFKSRADSEPVTDALGHITRQVGATPEHLIVDRGSEFECDHCDRTWCPAMNIRPRFGAVRRHGSIAVVERYHRMIKELLRQITVPEEQAEFEREVGLTADWCN